MATGWDIGADSPLLPFVDGNAGRASFAIDVKAVDGHPHVQGLLAGASDVDITPPPGMPKAGRSILSRNGSGFRGRLRARVLHLRSGTTSLALVQCDLLSGSSVVHHLVARAIADHTDISIAGLMIGATHTHSGPANFFGSEFYNRHAGNRKGFDAAYTQFLVARIADGVRQAHDTRRPAKLAVGQTEVWDMTRNRSHEAYVRNKNIDDKRVAPQRKFTAINPVLRLIRVDALASDGAYEPLSAAFIFSIHGTAISERRHEYTSDVFGYICEHLGDRIERVTGHRPIVGGMQGSHADVAPAVRPHQTVHLEAARVGHGIGEAAAGLYENLEAKLSNTVELSVGLREVDVRRSRSIDGVTIATTPALGAAQVAGAPENSTPILYHLPPFRRGTPKPFGRTGEHGAKWLLFGKRIQERMSAHQFPHVLPVQIWRIQSTALVALPLEITVEAGSRIQSTVASALTNTDIDDVAVTSLTNEYFGYVTTLEEYALQYYEGAHTIYGPNTQAFVAAHAARLAAEVLQNGRVEDVVAGRRFDLTLARYLPRLGGGAERSSLGAARYGDATSTTEGFWEWRWSDAAPGDLQWHEPFVSVEGMDVGGRWQPARDDGFALDCSRMKLEVSHLGTVNSRHQYGVRWWGPTLRRDRRHRFVLASNGGQPSFHSPAFD